MAASVREVDLKILGDGAIPSTNTDGYPPWQVDDTSASGSPTLNYLSEVVGVTGGADMALDNTNEVQNIRVYWGDSLSIDLNDLYEFGFLFRVSAAVGSASTVVMGLASEANDTPDTIAESAWFRIEGSASTTAIVVETDDATTNNDDVATGATVTTNTWYAAKITFKEGVDGALKDVRFYIQTPMGPGGGATWKRVASGTTFDMSGYSATTRGVQPYFQVQKTASTNTTGIQIAEPWMVVGSKRP